MKDTIVITNRHLVQGNFLEQIRKAAGFHPYAIILREKDLPEEEYEKLAAEVLKICEKEQLTCFLHSRFTIAEKFNHKNLHVSIAGLDELYKNGLTFENISVSCHSLEDVKKSISQGATQIILGTIFETDCKKGLKGKGTGFVNEICKYCNSHGNIPVFAIGGINPDTLIEVKEAGARGGCMMSYAMNGI